MRRCCRRQLLGRTLNTPKFLEPGLGLVVRDKSFWTPTPIYYLLLFRLIFQ